MAHRLESTENYLVSLIRLPPRGQVYSRGVRLLLWLLQQGSHLYWLAVQARRFLYDHDVLRRYNLGCQVISVGNLTVGGTGKTPVVEAFARELAAAGRKVAVLSRGYRKREAALPQRLFERLLLREELRPPRVVSDGRRLLLDSEMSGDEPYMLASNLPNVAVLVDKDRIKSGRYAINKLGCDTLILDDGFQYLSLRHRLDVVLVDRTNPFGNGHVLPRGILREPARNLAKAGFIFVTKSDGVGSDGLKARLREMNATAEIIECRHCPRHLRNLFTGESQPLEKLRDMPVVVLSGIAAPESFEQAIEQLGARILDRQRFADHHRFGQQEIIDAVNEARALGAAAILTTEKDAVRFPRLERWDVPVFFLRVDIEIVSGAEDFRRCISRICHFGQGGAAEGG